MERWSQEPRVGKISAAKTLKKKITEIAWATSFSLAWMTGAVAAMAEPPQIEDPTTIKVASLVSRLNKRWKKKATNKAIEMVERMTGREDFF